MGEEIRFIRDYVELEKLRLSGSHDIRLSVEGSPERREIAPLLLIPFVENAFKHGANAAGAGGFVRITAEIRNKEFVFGIENKVPLKAGKAPSESNGIGLANVKRRLALLYPEKHELMIHDDGDEYVVTLRLKI